MSSSPLGFPTNVDLNDSNPPAKPDAYNVEWQAGIAVPDPNVPGQFIRPTTACYRFPQIGGAVVITSDYQLGDSDSGRTFIANSTSAIVLTLPSVPPTFVLPQGIWNIRVKNLGTGDLTIDPNGANLDGLPALVVLAQNSGFEIDTDGTDYWTYGNFGGGALASPTVSLFADAETPSGTINSSNTAFSLANSPSPSASLELYQNGQLLTAGTDYTLSGSSITATVAPSTGDQLLAFYRYGSGSGSSFIDDETPSGTINGSNTAFTLSNAPNPPSSLELFLNGMMLRAGTDFTLSGAAITATIAPTTGDILRAFYRFIATASYNCSGEETPAGTIDSSNTAFTLGHSPAPAVSLRLFLNGILQKASTDYTLSGSSITMTTAPTTGDSLYAFYRY